ncbi:MAG: colicin V production protein [Desulfobulbus propionicus]|nr:MAG: colicin V production protein [Desulfobulbus propionicus]
MSFIADVSVFDMIVVCILFFFMIRGGWIGFMRQLAAFFALVGSYLLAGQYSGELVPHVQGFLENPRLVFLVSFGLMFLLFAAGFILLGKLLRKVMELTFLGWFDRLLGLGLGLVKGVVLTSMLYMFLASSLSSTNDMLKKSLVSPYLQLGASELQRWINDPEIRKYFLPKEPAISPDTVVRQQAALF